MTPLLLIVLLLWLPGALLHRGFGVARGPWGSGVFAIEATLSLAFATFVLLPAYLTGASVFAATAGLLAATAVLALAAAVSPRRRRLLATQSSSRAETTAFVSALLLLLPSVVTWSGANVDDWWDLSYVRGWLADGHFGFAQMALSPDPHGGASPLHPRFLWSVWLTLQAVVSLASGVAAWKVQAGALAAAVMFLVVSAQAALARALFRELPRSAALVAATVAITPAWIWGSEALPLFVRGYQDKLVAAFVLAPVLVALVIEASRQRGDATESRQRGDATESRQRGDATESRQRGEETALRRRGPGWLAVAAASVATVSVHSLVFTMAAFVAVLAIVARHGGGAVRWTRAHKATLAALLLPAVYPVGQALVLASVFGEQGVSLATPDNPVVRAHLSLNRLVGAGGPAWVVHPSAVFGSVALLLPLAIALLWRRRRDDSLRVLLLLAAVPCLLLFVPGLAALAGRLWVPWMLYRLGWMIPVAALLAWLLVEVAAGGGGDERRPAGRGALAAALACVLLVLATSTAVDRVRRNMREHPGPPLNVPTAAAAAVYDVLAALPGRDAVLAPPNFSELVPAIAGKPVVAFSERGTLVFSGDERSAYERLRDRATFYSASSRPADRDAVAAAYDVRWAVLPRRLVASGSEHTWLARYGPEALLAARAADARDGEPCVGRWCRGWWSATRASTALALSPSWSIVFETRDYFVVERNSELQRPAVADARVDAVAQAQSTADGVSRPRAEAGLPRWQGVFDLTPVAAAPAARDVLATASSAPGALVSYGVPPRVVLPSVSPIWLEGPGAWEDAPADVSIRFDIGVECVVSAVEVQPHLPRARRDVLELRSAGSVLRAAARHGQPLLLALVDASPRRELTLHLRSLLGAPVSLADVRLLGDRSSCGPPWPTYPAARVPQMASSSRALLELAAAVPPGGRALVSLARHSRNRGDARTALALLEEATTREPSLVEAWLELGFTHDEEAAREEAIAQTGSIENSSADERDRGARHRSAARAAFHAARWADSRSAWARGSAAWAEQRAGHSLAALWHAAAAAQIDPLYGDAWTVAAYALADLGLPGLAERALAAAASDDPDRNWPVLARADLAIARHYDDGAAAGEDLEAAREDLREWIERHPFDEVARAKLDAVAALAAVPATRSP